MHRIWKMKWTPASRVDGYLPQRFLPAKVWIFAPKFSCYTKVNKFEFSCHLPEDFYQRHFYSLEYLPANFYPRTFLQIFTHKSFSGDISLRVFLARVKIPRVNIRQPSKALPVELSLSHFNSYSVAFIILHKWKSSKAKQKNLDIL